MIFDFSEGRWNTSDFVSAAGIRVPYRLAFGQKEDCIHNEGADKAGDSYAYVSMVLPDKVEAPCLVSTECRFTKYGAPLIILADELIDLPDGRRQYGRHIEVVGWEKGINVWDLIPDPTANRGQRSQKIGAFSCPVADGQRFEIIVKADKNGLKVGLRMDGELTEFDCPCELKESFYVGITACEGENYFYNFKVEK